MAASRKWGKQSLVILTLLSTCWVSSLMRKKEWNCGSVTKWNGILKKIISFKFSRLLGFVFFVCLTPVLHIGKLKTHLRNKLRRVKYWTRLTSVYTDESLKRFLITCSMTDGETRTKICVGQQWERIFCGLFRDKKNIILYYIMCTDHPWKNRFEIDFSFLIVSFCCTLRF